MSPNWEGLFCALWTPTDPNGQLMEAALRSNVDFCKSRGVDGIFALGSTGEFLHLDLAVRKQAMRAVAAAAPPLRVIMNISHVRPAVVMELGRFAHELGLESVSVLPPYYFRLAQDDLIEFFVRVGDATRLPLFLYNFPERTGNRIDLETVAAVAARIPVAGVKQSGAEFEYHRALVQLGREKGFVVFTGADTRLADAVPMGVSGCVSGLANAVPELVSEALRAARRNADVSEDLSLKRLAQLERKLGVVNFPLDVAAAMEARDLPVGAPKTMISAQTLKSYAQLKADLRSLFHEWNLA